MLVKLLFIPSLTPDCVPSPSTGEHVPADASRLPPQALATFPAPHTLADPLQTLYILVGRGYEMTHWISQEKVKTRITQKTTSQQEQTKTTETPLNRIKTKTHL